MDKLNEVVDLEALADDPCKHVHYTLIRYKCRLS